jgi:hypothetical protein
MKRYTFWRNAIVSETYEFEAESEEAAREMLMNGEVEVHSEEWIDWATDQFELEFTEELDPLYCMVKEYTVVDSLVE